MKNIEVIRQQITSGNFNLTRHALQRIVERNIDRQEIKETGLNVTIIENYPDDKYSPSCLLLGFTKNNRPLHIQVSRRESSIVVIITIYEPNEGEWINYYQRR